MKSTKNKKTEQSETLDDILQVVKKLSEQISQLDHRISILERPDLPETPTANVFDSIDTQISPQVDFDDKDEMLKRAYQVLAEAQKPMTTQEVAQRIGRSRSTTSQYLNELHHRNLLQKTQGTTPDKSRNIVFSAIEISRD